MKPDDTSRHSEPFMTLRQVAEYLNLAERTIYLWAQQGEFPAYKLGSTWRFKREEIDEWLEQRRTHAKDETWHEKVAAAAESISEMMRKEDQKFFLPSQFTEIGSWQLVEQALDLLVRRGECKRDTAEFKPGHKQVIIIPAWRE